MRSESMMQADYRHKMNQAVMQSGVVNTTETLIELPDGHKKIYCSQTFPLYDAFE